MAAIDEPWPGNSSERTVSAGLQNCSGYGSTPHLSCCAERKEQPLKVINSLNGKWEAQIIEREQNAVFLHLPEKQIFLIQREKNY